MYTIIYIQYIYTIQIYIYIYINMKIFTEKNIHDVIYTM